MKLPVEQAPRARDIFFCTHAHAGDFQSSVIRNLGALGRNKRDGFLAEFARAEAADTRAELADIEAKLAQLQGGVFAIVSLCVFVFAVLVLIVCFCFWLDVCCYGCVHCCS